MAAELERISTGIQGLDSLIEGGIPRGFTVLVAGNPGTGKTILSSHFLYAGLKSGEAGIYVSFSESRQQFYANVNRLGLDFVKYEKEGKFLFLDFASFTKEGIGDALEEVLASIREINAKRIVVDSFSAIAQAFENQNEARIALQVILGKMTRAEGVTNLLISEVPVGSETVSSGIEEFVVDGIVKMEHGKTNSSPMVVRVLKMRGTELDREPHVLAITKSGMSIFEKQPIQFSFPVSEERLSSGIQNLDERMSGGFLKGTTTALVGASGVGKTTFSFQFIAEGVKRGERGIFCSLEESPDEIRRSAKRYGYDMEDLEKKGLVILSWIAENQNPDEFMSFLKGEIERSRPVRLTIDSLSAFEHLHRDEMYVITKRLISMVRQYHLTAMITILTSQSAGMNLTDLGISSLFQNILMLRYVEIEGRMRRSMLLLKMRATPHDESILEFTISDGKGLEMIGTMEKYFGILTGVAQRMQKEAYDFSEKEQTINAQQEAARRKRLEEFKAREREITKQEEAGYDQRREALEEKIKGIKEQKKERGKGSD